MKLFKLLIVSLMTLSACARDIPRSTVKITNLAENSGGSGSIVYNSSILSQVLTNGHVCEVAKSGGIITTSEGKKFYVDSYRKSLIHDLCLINVSSDLGYHTLLAPFPPTRFEEITVSGHPHLLPIMITKGALSDKETVTVMMGIRPCTDKEASDPTTGLFCLFMNGLPVLKTFQAIAESATIQPGSSGSGVYNSQGQIVAVIFAGGSDFGYGFAVPYEYIYNFLNEEVSTIASKLPSPEGSAPKDKQERSLEEKLEDACDHVQTSEQDALCKALGSIVNGLK